MPEDPLLNLQHTVDNHDRELTRVARSASMPKPLSSRIKPLLEIRFEALEHLSFNVFDVGEPAPTSDIAVFRCTLNLHNKFFH